MRGVIFLVLLTTAVSAYALAMSDGNALHNYCSAMEATDFFNDKFGDDAIALMKMDSCVSYINGWTAGYILGLHAAKNNYPTACTHERINSTQVVDVVKQYLLKHPEERHLPAGALIGFALTDAFPCK